MSSSSVAIRRPSNDGRPFAQLEAVRRWVGWRSERRGDKLTKVPYSAPGRHAQTNNPATWRRRADLDGRILDAIRDHPGGADGPSGVGVVLGEIADDRMLAGVDLDTCLNDAGSIAGWAGAILDRVPSYAEVSPSGTGVKVFFLCSKSAAKMTLGLLGKSGPTDWGVKQTIPGLANGGDHPPAIEIYFAGRYFAVTGQHWEGSPAEIAELDEQQLGILRRSDHRIDRQTRAAISSP